MKKTMLIVLMTVATFALAACAKKEAEPQQTEAVKEEEMAGLPNPMVETDADGITEKLGVKFNVPEGAENVKYFIIDNKVAEMQFTYGEDTKCCARIQSLDKFTDISGMYYQWNYTETEEAKVDYNDVTIMGYNGKDEMVQVCLWYDAAPGYMYSVSASGKDLNGFDIIAVAQQTYVPLQGDVG